VNGGLTYSPDDVVDFDTDGAILVLRSSNIQEGKISYLDNVYVNVKVNKKQMTTIGDILICSRNGSRRLLGKNILIDENSKNLAFGAFMTILRTKYNRFVRYYLASGVFNDLLNSSTSTINQLTTRDINNIEIPLPPFIEQEKIVKFLDDKCSKVDQEVSLLQKKSILLDEYKNALIYETVTKGLDKNAEMKDSGVEWIGEIPNHWKVKRIKDYYNLGMGSTILKEDLIDDGMYPVYSATAEDKFFGYVNDVRIPLIKGDLVIPARGNSIGFVKKVENVGIHTCTQTTIYAKNKYKNNNPYYYFYMIGNKNSLFFYDQTAIPQITVSQIKGKMLLIPPVNEQNEIASFLKLETMKIEKQIELINKKVELLKEYKQSLIYEAVTGQLEIE
ncbi:MAG: restriction endonuclease subunit S, partial [Longicatena sp.]